MGKSEVGLFQESLPFLWSGSHFPSSGQEVSVLVTFVALCNVCVHQVVLSLSSVPGLLWRAHSFKRAGATDELSECQAQNRGTYLWVFLEYCIFFTVRAFFFPFTRKEDQGSWQGPCDFCISPSSRSLFSSFLRADHFFPFLLALKVLSCLRQEVSKGLFGITEKLSKLCSFFSRLRSIVP